MAQLELHYAARIAALALCQRGDTRAAIAALRLERDDARGNLRRQMLEAEQDAVRRAVRLVCRRRPVIPPPAEGKGPERAPPARPAVVRPARLVRRMTRWRPHHSL